ncbi:hypothetical protein CEXT_734321 [Caerostris extrusa]|uniref:Uncharacterized protein n=1 Tax=Caerostris extrusa TaxID=172846 RepID=A0AAV4UWI6_CAEEX|nr:hypothetical protein CEXT_734321 [Caerostris extrusa]
MEPIAASNRLIRNSIRFVTQTADCFSCEAHEPPGAQEKEESVILAKNELSEFWERPSSIFVSKLQGLIIVMTPQIRNGALIDALLPYVRLSSLG